MTEKLFIDDAYLSTAEGTVLAANDDEAVILDATNFYAMSGGQPGDTGHFERRDGSRIGIADTRFGDHGKTVIHHILADGEATPEVGERLVLHIDWDRRYRLMQMHTACHILSVVCPLPITGASVSETDSRVDFDMSETADKAEITEKMQAIIDADHPVFTRWITEAELDANPNIVRSKNVRPPRGVGDIRLVCIGEDAAIDSQPCGGTHVERTGELGKMHIGKIEKKGRENRRMRIRFGELPT